MWGKQDQCKHSLKHLSRFYCTLLKNKGRYQGYAVEII